MVVLSLFNGQIIKQNCWAKEELIFVILILLSKKKTEENTLLLDFRLCKII